MTVTDLSAELLNTADHQRHVPTVVQVNCLEQTSLRHAVCLAEVDERLDVLHL